MKTDETQYTAVIACRTIEDELTAAMERTGICFPVYWLESGLHNTPKKLKKRLQEAITGAGEKRLLLAMGFCGNSVAGICSEEHELILPAVDDCISLLLGSPSLKAQISREQAAYFLTDGWMRGERNLWVEYQYTVEKYGEETAESIAQMMYGHYRTLGLLDPGVGDIAALLENTRIIADTLHLTQKVIPAGLSFLEELLKGPWENERFLRFGPDSTIRESDLRPF